MEQLRQAAVSAFHWLDSHERLQVALNSRSRPPHLTADALVPGTVVYFFKIMLQGIRGLLWLLVLMDLFEFG